MGLYVFGVGGTWRDGGVLATGFGSNSDRTGGILRCIRPRRGSP